MITDGRSTSKQHLWRSFPGYAPISDHHTEYWERTRPELEEYCLDHLSSKRKWFKNPRKLGLLGKVTRDKHFRTNILTAEILTPTFVLIAWIWTHQVSLYQWSLWAQLEWRRSKDLTQSICLACLFTRLFLRLIVRFIDRFVLLSIPWDFGDFRNCSMFWILGEWDSACLCHPVIVDKVASGSHLSNSSSLRVFTSFFTYGILSFNKRLPIMRPSVFVKQEMASRWEILHFLSFDILHESWQPKWCTIPETKRPDLLDRWRNFSSAKWRAFITSINVSQVTLWWTITSEKEFSFEKVIYIHKTRKSLSKDCLMNKQFQSVMCNL
jgi:hypothetical protein